MKKISVKKIAALAAGAVMLGASVVGAAYWQDVPITNDAGAPQVKVVVGANAAASDGVAAANIAARIGNLAFKSGSTYTAVAKGLDGVSCQKVEGTSTGGSVTCTPTISNEQVQLDVTLPGVVTGAYNFKPSINDYIDKKLNNRINSGSEDQYQSTVTDVSPWAAQDTLKISGTAFTPIASATVRDTYSGKSYTEEQSIWLRGQVQYDETLDTLIAKSMKLAYRAEFTQDSYGIPFCTALANGAGNDYTQCASNNDRTDRHRVSVKFLGEDWIISGMSVNTGASTGGTGTLYDPGSTVSLAKEGAYRVLHIGENLSSGAYSVRLADIGLAEGATNVHPAAIEIYDANGVKLKEDKVDPGTTYSWTATDGTNLKIKVYTTQPGYTLNSKWAEIALYSQEITLTSGDTIDNDKNADWDVSIGWRDKGYTAAANQTDHLREILLINDANTAKMQKGDTLDIVGDPVVFQLEFGGVDLADADYNLVTYTVDNAADLKVSSGQSCETADTQDLTGQQLLQVSAKTKDSFEIEGFMVNTFYVNLKGDMGNKILSLYYKPSGASCWYNATSATYINALKTQVTVKFAGIGDDQSAANGGVLYVNNNSITGGFEVGAIEDAGYNSTTRAVDKFAVLLYNISSKYKFTTSTTSSTSNAINYTAAIAGGPAGFSVTMPTGVDATYMTERGTKVYDIDSTGWSFDAAKKIGSGNFYLRTKEGMATDATQVTLKEGESRTLQGGVIIKATSITETVGSCSVDATGAGITCQATGKEGVKAKVSGNGQESDSVTASVPYQLTGDLVVLDANAEKTGTLISVGGDKANEISKAAIATGDTPVDWEATPVVVKKYGNVIVVAGKTSDDTTKAAAQFIAELK
ncbi:Uncharacterised protein [Candidatus Gugararchaeum adminiculabundum]|nr:Uncharacterised protein [Candidatus Gugararchaeum adminiculabundum]